jgi:hypothetical protein
MMEVLFFQSEAGRNAINNDYVSSPMAFACSRNSEALTKRVTRHESTVAAKFSLREIVEVSGTSSLDEEAGLPYNQAMQGRTLLFVLGCLVAPNAYAGRFEGTLHMKVTHRHGGGTMRVMIGKSGVRSEVKVTTPNGGQMDMVFLQLFKNADVAYRIDDSTKTYTEIDLKAAREGRPKNEGAGYVAKKVGVDSVSGYSCTHVLITDANGNETDMWTTKELGDVQEMTKLMGPNAPANEGMSAALKTVGAEGFPVKVVHRSEHSTVGETTMELTKADRQAPPSSSFALPSAYRKIELQKHDDHGVKPPGALSSPAKKQLEERLKGLSPEEREAALRQLRAQGVLVD